ncbi:hypothetical protein [Sodalis-like endosymbiont of Proechinophthirus fluctus]|uniref:hypothetical protein n=1 Tax=Sodalis-like endosymbiont of Proechinophthirus fluctus TaxID=1462730 RepID=UPI00164FD53E|nr:hypothetical protein [Sodalis-like endosymbiont of Proechinophthirus fluctus]
MTIIPGMMHDNSPIATPESISAAIMAWHQLSGCAIQAITPLRLEGVVPLLTPL